MKFLFTEDSGLYPTTPISCAASGDTTVYSAIGCSATFNTDPYVIVTGLNTNEFSYAVEISSIVNAPHSGFVNDIWCEFCTDNACSSTLETGTKARITFEEDVMDSSNVDVSFSDTTNGYIGSTMSVGMLISHNIVVSGSISLDLPKQNYYNWYLGAPNRECLIYECEPYNVEVTVSM
jgi:hypothetical protein